MSTKNLGPPLYGKRGKCRVNDYLSRLAQKNYSTHNLLSSQLLGALWLGPAAIHWTFGLWRWACLPLPHVYKLPEWQLREIKDTGAVLPENHSTWASSYVTKAHTFSNEFLQYAPSALRINGTVVPIYKQLKNQLPEIRETLGNLCGHTEFMTREHVYDAVKVLPEYWARPLWLCLRVFSDRQDGLEEYATFGEQLQGITVNGLHGSHEVRSVISYVTQKPTHEVIEVTKAGVERCRAEWPELWETTQ